MSKLACDCIFLLFFFFMVVGVKLQFSKVNFSIEWFMGCEEHTIWDGLSSIKYVYVFISAAFALICGKLGRTYFTIQLDKEIRSWPWACLLLTFPFEIK